MKWFHVIVLHLFLLGLFFQGYAYAPYYLKHYQDIDPEYADSVLVVDFIELKHLGAKEYFQKYEWDMSILKEQKVLSVEFYYGDSLEGLPEIFPNLNALIITNGIWFNGIEKFRELKYILIDDFHNCWQKYLPIDLTSVCQCKNLEVLIVRSKAHKIIPSEIVKLKKLKRLLIPAATFYKMSGWEYLLQRKDWEDILDNGFYQYADLSDVFEVFMLYKLGGFPYDYYKSHLGKNYYGDYFDYDFKFGEDSSFICKANVNSRCVKDYPKSAEGSVSGKYKNGKRCGIWEYKIEGKDRYMTIDYDKMIVHGKHWGFIDEKTGELYDIYQGAKTRIVYVITRGESLTIDLFYFDKAVKVQITVDGSFTNVTVTDADEHYETYYTMENGHIYRRKCSLADYRHVNAWVEEEKIEKDTFLDTILIIENKIIENYGHNDR